MTHYDSTARVPFAKGGKVDKKPKPKRIILWKGKVKDWPGAQKAKERTGKAKGGRIGRAALGGTEDRPGRHPPVKKEKTRKEKQADYIKKHGKPEGRRKTLAVTDKYKKIRDSLGLKLGQKPKWKKMPWKAGQKPKWKKMPWKPGQKPKMQPLKKGGEVGLDDYKKSRLSKWVKKYGAKGLRPQAKAEGGIMSLKKGGKADKKWIQGVNKSIKARGTKGVCTGKKFGSASCKPGSRRYNLAKTFKKMARSRHASGGLVRYI